MSFRCKRYGIPQQVTSRLVSAGKGTYATAYLPAITVCQYQMYHPYDAVVNIILSKIRIRVGGTAAVSLRKATHIPTGSGLVGGDAQEAIAPVHSGGAIMAGAATWVVTRLPSISGGILAASTAVPTVKYNNALTSAGAKGAGSATETFTDN